MNRTIQCLGLCLLFSSSSLSFAPPKFQSVSSRTTCFSSNYPGADFGGPGATNGNVGNIEQIEFKIYPDGRVEETVRGVKGNNCHQVTEQINEALGKVVASEGTEELYEQEVVIDQTITQTNGGSASWDGSTSW